tara:strand:- start:480 stop:1409 length:930 start_codon:yes stop_codon:yes gene_type:complete
MSNKIFGKLPSSIEILSDSVDVREVPVSIRSFKNRRTEARVIKGYLKASGGKFDRRIWQEPLVAELPDGTRYLFDGDHRRALYKMAYPTKETMPVQVVRVKDKEEISRLFVTINKTARKSLTSNEVFVHEYLGGIPDAVNTGQTLARCNLKVDLGTGEPGTYVGHSAGQQVKIDGFRKAVKDTGAQPVLNACTFIQSVWPEEKFIGAEMLHGFALLDANTSLLRNNKHKQWFQKFMAHRRDGTSNSKKVVTSLKAAGRGRATNNFPESVALGTLLEFKDWVVSRNHISRTTFKRHYGKYVVELKKKVDI